MSLPGLPGDENPNPQWKLPPEPSKWQSGWTPGASPLEEEATEVEPAPPAWQRPPAAAPPPTPGQAVGALVVSIAGLVFCPLIASVVGLVLGYQAKRRIDGSGGALGGRAVALAAIVLGWVGVVVYGAVVALAVLGAVLSSSPA